MLERVNADKKFAKTEVAQLKRLTALPSSRFEKKDEFIPSPYDAEDGVTIKADPRKWLEVEDFGSHLARSLDLTVSGKTASKAGTIDFTYGNRNIKVEVKQGESLTRVMNKLESAIMKKEGSISVQGWYDENKSGKQTIKIEVL